MKKKCLFFDIDGTLVDEQTHQIPQSTIEALRAARRSGSVVFINTGRPYSHVSAQTSVPPSNSPAGLSAD